MTIYHSQPNIIAMKMGAVIDSTGTYRYTLWREWDAIPKGPATPLAPRVVFVMLNPSTACATTDDPTIRRCTRFAQSWGYGSVEVVNLFAYRASYPKILRSVPDPIGLENDRYLVEASQSAHLIVVAWGNHGTLGNRHQSVLSVLADKGRLCCLGMTKAGHPRHPLYIRSETTPVPYIMPT